MQAKISLKICKESVLRNKFSESGYYLVGKRRFEGDDLN